VSEVVAKLAPERPAAAESAIRRVPGSLLLRAGGKWEQPTSVCMAKKRMARHAPRTHEHVLAWSETTPGSTGATALNGPTLLEGDHPDAVRRGGREPQFSLDQMGRGNAEKDAYRRFVRGVPPRSKGDYAFILHMLAVARPGEGRVAVRPPRSGVSSAGGAEGRIASA